QSPGHVAVDSVPVHMPSPQRGCAGQSPGQLTLVSPPLHTPSPHRGTEGQSAAHVAVLSVPLHAASPQNGAPVPSSPPHATATPIKPTKPTRYGPRIDTSSSRTHGRLWDGSNITDRTCNCSSSTS